jgi:Tfp pilus assembly protein PilZ
MVDHFDDRGAKRTAYVTPLEVKDLKTGEIYEAKMLDYSDGGISFASDGFFDMGTPLYFAILYPPEYFSSRVFEYYKGEVVRRIDLKESDFKYGYGVQLASESIRQESSANDTNIKEEKRKHPRRSFATPMRFDTQNKIFDGSTKNISASGVFIAASEDLKVGQLINLNLPLKKGKMVRATGKIVWANDEGFGLKFTEIKNKRE